MDALNLSILIPLFYVSYKILNLSPGMIRVLDNYCVNRYYFWFQLKGFLFSNQNLLLSNTDLVKE